MIPAIFATQDRDIGAAIFCLRQFQAKGLSNGLEFLIPFQSDAARLQFEADLPDGLTYRLIRTPWKFGAMIGALAAHLGDAKTLFFASSDRYPINPVSPEIFQALRALALSDRWDGVRFCAWKEEVEDRAAARLPDGTILYETRPGCLFGSWHPQFMSRTFFDRLLGRTADRQSLLQWQNTAMLPVLGRSRRFLVPDTQLLFFEEPMCQGAYMLNYRLRQIASGERLAQDDGIDPRTAIFTHASILKINDHFKVRGASAILNRSLPSMPVTVHTLGGAGSKMLLRWLYEARQDTSTAIGRAHCHWRLPPATLPAGQQMVYIYSNPIESVLSFFARRDSRHERHGLGAHPDTQKQARPDFAIAAQANSEAARTGLTEQDDSARYLRHGLDLFRTEEHLNNYLYADRSYPILFLRYETLWDHLDTLRGLFPETGAFPKFVQRRSRLDTLSLDVADGYTRLYEGTIRRMAALPDVFLVQNGVRQALA